MNLQMAPGGSKRMATYGANAGSRASSRCPVCTFLLFLPEHTLERRCNVTEPYLLQAKFPERRETDLFLSWQPPVQHRGGQYIKGPLCNVNWIDGALVMVVQQRKHVDIRLSPRASLIDSGFRVPSGCWADPE